jgi:hypothetical protein
VDIGIHAVHQFVYALVDLKYPYGRGLNTHKPSKLWGEIASVYMRKSLPKVIPKDGVLKGLTVFYLYV